VKRNRWKSDRLTSLDRRYHTKVRQEYCDYDYIHRLNADEKEWLADFTKRYLAADFTGEGRTFFRKGKKRKEIFSGNNARNRCQYGISRAVKMLDVTIKNANDTYLLDDKISDASNHESVLIEWIDRKKALVRSVRKLQQRKVKVRIKK
jgi:hypothetical protein